VLPTSGLAEAADALTVERFDAVLMESEFRTLGLKEFSAMLRKLEKSQRGACRIPLIGLSQDDREATGADLDAIIPEPVDPDAVTTTVLRLSQAVSNSSSSEMEDLVVIDAEKFKEQVGFDDELMIEIIDLFLSERTRQESEMQEALMAKKFDQLSRLAHTIKGSLGALHALRARSRAQNLEIAAKQQDESVCIELLSGLESDLVALEPELLKLKQG
jgi:HPt (histidine-containing phosphotransfer) domain-containing protein